MSCDVLLPIVTLKSSVHRHTHQVLLYFKYNNELITRLRKIPNARWSDTLRCWYLPYVDDTVKVICTALEGVATLDVSSLVGMGSLQPIAEKRPERVLNDAQRGILNTFYLYLKGKRYSDSTVKTYTYLVADFVEFCGEKTLELLTNRDVELFIEDVLKRKRFSISTQRQFISAMKLFVVLYPVVGIHNLELERPKKSRFLPTVLSQGEIIALLRVTKNIKHRTILGLLYSGGLRIGELLALKLKDLDFERRQIYVRMGKGRKDRVVGMSETMIPLLMNYIESFKPIGYVIEGRGGGMYSAVSVRSFLKVSCKIAAIKKDVTPHCLRHSYATHMLENGVDIRYIQALLGHSKPETTMIYTHVAQKTLLQISNPLDVAVKHIKENREKQEKVSISRQLKG